MSFEHPAQLGRRYVGIAGQGLDPIGQLTRFYSRGALARRRQDAALRGSRFNPRPPASFQRLTATYSDFRGAIISALPAK